MKTHLNRKALTTRVSTILGVTLLGAWAPLVAQAGQSALPTYNALVSWENNLYLVSPAGKVLTQFTSDGAQKFFASISPDGSKVAYALNKTASVYSVVNRFGQSRSYQVFPKGQNNSYVDSNSSYLMGLKWSTDKIVRLTDFYGRDYALFAFRRVPNDLSSPAPPAAKSAIELNCVLKKGGGPVACMDQQGFVSLGRALDKSIYSVSQTKMGASLESFTVHVGESTTPQVGPPYKITIESISKNKLMINMDALKPEYASGAYETQIENGSYVAEMDYATSVTYLYSATIINAKTGLVRIDVSKDNAPDVSTDMGLAWQPRGQGLLFVQRTKTQTFLDLIQPGRGHVSGHPAKGQGPQWHLAAQVPISLPEEVRSMRFLTPSLLLLDTGNFRGHQYSEVPIHIANGRDDGKPSLSVGRMKPLTPTHTVKIDGKSATGTVLDWSCKAAHGDAD
jgi:hypothetical protein